MIKSSAKFVLAAVLGWALLGGATAQPICGVALDEIYSNADGSVQFFLLPSWVDSCTGQTLVAGNGEVENTFTFPANPGLVQRQPVLVATQGFADLHLVDPDFIVLNGFLPTRNGALALRPGNWEEGTPRATSIIRYGTLPTDGVKALYRIAQDVGGPPSGAIIAYGEMREFPETAQATNNAGQTYIFPLATTFSGLWWNAPSGSEQGWGLALEHQGDTIFAAWAIYDTDESPTWFVMPAAKHYIPGAKDFEWGMFWGYLGAPNTYVGSVYKTTGPTFNSLPFKPSDVTATLVGYGQLSFSTNSDDTSTNDIRNSRASISSSRFFIEKVITRQVFDGPVSICSAGAAPGSAPNFQGLWWDPAESGWGLQVNQQGDSVFAVWFTYDATFKARWFVMFANKTAPNTYAGTLYRTTGPAYTATEFDSSRVTRTPVGSGTLAFADRNSGAFSYSVDGLAQTKPIARQILSHVPTVCNQ